MLALPGQGFGQFDEAIGARARRAESGGKPLAQTRDGLCEGSLGRQGSAAEKPRLLNKRKSLLGNQLLGRTKPLQRQFRFAAVEVKRRALNQGQFEAERMVDSLGQ
jgi:hypothetical protein